MWATRYGLPAVLFVAGIVLIVIGGGTDATAGAGVVLLGTALMVWMINWMFRLSVSSNRDRDKEEAAREYFTRHGRWPGEKGK